ncbi:hypothetical protein GS534_00760 [Rhodococcus hoagii]|nr:hypothetical protein [Prescottella equi]
MIETTTLDGIRADMASRFQQGEPQYKMAVTAHESAVRNAIVDAFSHLQHYSMTESPAAGYSGLALRMDALRHLYFTSTDPDDAVQGIEPGSLERFSAYFSEATNDQLQALLREITEQLTEAPASLCVRIDSWLNDALDDLAGVQPDEVRARAAIAVQRFYTRAIASDPVTPAVKEALKAANQARDEAVKLALAARQAAGLVGEGELAKAFKSHAQWAFWGAVALSTASVGTMVGALVFGYNMIHDVADVPTSLILAKAALTIPILAISAYIGRLAGHQWESSRWGRSAAVQLQTLDAFTKGLASDEARDEVKSILARRIFSTPDFGGSGSSSDVSDTIELVKTITDTVQKVKPGG